MYELISLNLSSLNAFSPFICERIRTKIDTRGVDFTLLAYGALDHQHPVGLCLGLLNSTLNFLEFLSIEVDKEHRNQHIGRTLIAHVQAAAIKQGAKIFSLVYPQDTPETPAIEKILIANQWKGSRPFLLSCLFCPETFNAPLLHLKYEYPAGYKEFLWKNLSERQREDLLNREKKHHFSPSISPFREEASLEPLNSLGLQYNKRVVGWVITQRLDPETIRYSSFYIEPQLKYKSLAIKLLVDSMRLHKQHPTRYATIEIPCLQVHPSWIQFIKKRIVPSAIKVTEFQQGWHAI